ncbi:hypothetical protein ACLOJK_024259 [Asimina triloba]
MYTVVGTLPEHRFRCSIFPKLANPAAMEDPSPAAIQSDPSGSDPTMVRDHRNMGPCKNLTDRSTVSIGGQRPTTVRRPSMAPPAVSNSKTWPPVGGPADLDGDAFFSTQQPAPNRIFSNPLQPASHERPPSITPKSDASDQASPISMGGQMHQRQLHTPWPF